MSSKPKSKPKKYVKPPITEAIIEIRFSESISRQRLDNLAKKRKECLLQNLEAIELKIKNSDEGPEAEAARQFLGYKLVNKSDSTQIIQAKFNALSVSKLPPYEDWPALFSTFKDNYQWYNGTRFRELTRIGVRYINRIDIPAKEFNLEDYFNINVHTPDAPFPDMVQFALQIAVPLDANKFATINLGKSPEQSPLINHTSIIFDIDVYQMQNLPKTDREMDVTFDCIRTLKDDYFEKLLTEKCKKLFN